MLRSVIYVAILSVAGVASAAASDAKAAGKKVFTEQKCAMCHSVGVKGNKKGPLDEVGSKLSADDIREWIVDAKGMTAKAKAARKPVMKSVQAGQKRHRRARRVPGGIEEAGDVALTVRPPSAEGALIGHLSNREQ